MYKSSAGFSGSFRLNGKSCRTFNTIRSTGSFDLRGCSPAAPLLGARLTLRRRHCNLKEEALDGTELAVDLSPDRQYTVTSLVIWKKFEKVLKTANFQGPSAVFILIQQ